MRQQHCGICLIKSLQKIFLACFQMSFFLFCPLSWPLLLLPLSWHPSPPLSKSALLCRAKGTARSLKGSSFRVDISTKFRTETPSRSLREKRSASVCIDIVGCGAATLISVYRERMRHRSRLLSFYPRRDQINEFLKNFRCGKQLRSKLGNRPYK